MRLSQAVFSAVLALSLLLARDSQAQICLGTPTNTTNLWTAIGTPCGVLIPNGINVGPRGGMLNVLRSVPMNTFSGQDNAAGNFHFPFAAYNNSGQGTFGLGGSCGDAAALGGTTAQWLPYPTGIQGTAYNGTNAAGVKGASFTDVALPAGLTNAWPKAVSGIAGSSVTATGTCTLTGLYGSAAPNSGSTWPLSYGAYTTSGSSGTVTSAFGTYGAVAGAGAATNAYGVYGSSTRGTNRYGLYGSTSSTGSSFQAGVYGVATPNGTLNSQNGTWSNNSSWAIYSNGAQFSTTHALWSTSDSRLKENIKPLTGALAAIMALAPKTYTYRRSLHPTFNLPEGEQMGLISQEVEKVLPALVMDTRSPDQYDAEGRMIDAGFEFKAMSYTGLLPLLVGAIKEQQTTIEDKQSQIDALNERLSNLEKKLTGAAGVGALDNTKARLEQNAPNPFNENTVIRFFVPDGSRRASLQVMDVQGKEWKTFDNLTNGDGQLVIGAGSMPAGSYSYTLFVDREKVATRTMVITR